MDWSVEAIDRLRALWGEGLSTAEIGRRMGVSKNAVVGKAHRLSLPARPSPIRRDPSSAAPRAVPAAAVRAPMMRGGAAAVAASRQAAVHVGAAVPAVGGGFVAASPRGAMAAKVGPAAAAQQVVAASAAASPAPAVVRSFPISATPRAAGGVRRCCWPIGEPGTPEFHFCSSEATPGKPYCADHAAIAYVRARDRREDAA